MFYVNSTAGANIPGGAKHYHSAVEFYLLTEGDCNYLIDDELYEIKAGDLVYIPQGVIHKTTYSGRHSRTVINCPVESFGDVPLPSFRVFRNGDVYREMKRLFADVEREYKQDDSFSQTLMEGYMRAFVALMHRHQNCYVNERQANKTIQEILAFLHEQYTSDITLQDLAQRYGVSAEHISRTFKKETGLNFIEYLSQLRLKKAETMLKFGNDSIAEIAFACGFNDSNYFSEKFKKVYKRSPGQFRKMQRS
ncbi:MAG: helix-turn-helix transcriptional regulator [Clostridia bacterium]|nr:helix-turn-helix transcriptional regulator [Clostridia bacterium]